MKLRCRRQVCLVCPATNAFMTQPVTVRIRQAVANASAGKKSCSISRSTIRQKCKAIRKQKEKQWNMKQKPEGVSNRLQHLLNATQHSARTGQGHRWCWWKYAAIMKRNYAGYEVRAGVRGAVLDSCIVVSCALCTQPGLGYICKIYCKCPFPK